jgi:hypothetical protein
MTNSELNRDIKRLLKEVARIHDSYIELINKNEYNKAEEALKKEFARLYNADQTFSSMNRTSILIMLRLNVRLRAIPFHQFGLFIKLAELE